MPARPFDFASPEPSGEPIATEAAESPEAASWLPEAVGEPPFEIESFGIPATVQPVAEAEPEPEAARAPLPAELPPPEPAQAPSIEKPAAVPDIVSAGSDPQTVDEKSVDEAGLSARGWRRSSAANDPSPPSWGSSKRKKRGARRRPRQRIRTSGLTRSSTGSHKDSTWAPRALSPSAIWRSNSASTLSTPSGNARRRAGELAAERQLSHLDLLVDVREILARNPGGPDPAETEPVATRPEASQAPTAEPATAEPATAETKPADEVQEELCKESESGSEPTDAPAERIEVSAPETREQKGKEMES